MVNGQSCPPVLRPEERHSKVESVIAALQFHGVENAQLLATLGIAVSAALLAYGVWRLTLGRRGQPAIRPAGGAALPALAAIGAGLVALGLSVFAAYAMPMARTAQRVLWMLLMCGIVALGSDELPLTVAAHSKETDRLARQSELLRTLAAAREGGRYAELSALPEIVDTLVQRSQRLTVPLPAAAIYPLYNFPVLFFVLVGLLSAEWLLHRRWQLQ